MAYTPFGAPAQFPEVAAYIIVPTATGFDHCELGGRNGAGFCRSLPDCSPTTCNWPSAATAYPTITRPRPRAADIRCARNPQALTAALRTGAGRSALTSRSRRRAARWPAAARFDGNALAGLAEQAAITLLIPSRRRWRRARGRCRRGRPTHNARWRRRYASAAGARRRRQRTLKRARPDDVPGVVVEHVQLVRTAGDE